MLKRFLFALLFLPQISFAAVRISEVAWMGTSDSSSNEWIELRNDGTEEISLSGYKLTSADAGLNVLLKGSIPSDSYYLIERTDDNSVPNITADLVASFGSGLSNAGETLRILDSSGQIVDEVIGGTNWKDIGGDSVTKNTPQWTGSKWVTAVPTPGQATLIVADAATDTLQDVSTDTPKTITTTTITTSSSGSSSHASSAKAEVPKKIRDTFRMEVKFVGNIIKDIPKVFSAKVYGFSDEELPNAKIKWNFGDGTTGEGSEVTHTYKFKGIYPIVIHASHNDTLATSHTKIEVLDQNIKITDAVNGIDGFVKITSQNDTDISGWSVRSGYLMFTFPEGTELYAKTPISFANSITGIVDHSALALHRNDGKIISVFGDSDANDETVITNHISYAKITPKKVAEVMSPEPIVSTTTDATNTWSLASVIKSGERPSWIYWALFIFFGTVIGVIIYASKVFNPNREIEDEASKYTLVEIDSNLE